MEASKSPVLARPLEPKRLSFYEALKEVLSGKKITKSEWNNKEYYGFLDESELRLHKPDGKICQWIISEGDMIGVDWIIL